MRQMFTGAINFNFSIIHKLSFICVCSFALPELAACLPAIRLIIFLLAFCNSVCISLMLCHCRYYLTLPSVAPNWTLITFRLLFQLKSPVGQTATTTTSTTWTGSLSCQWLSIPWYIISSDNVHLWIEHNTCLNSNATQSLLCVFFLSYGLLLQTKPFWLENEPSALYSVLSSKISASKKESITCKRARLIGPNDPRVQYLRTNRLLWSRHGAIAFNLNQMTVFTHLVAPIFREKWQQANENSKQL